MAIPDLSVNPFTDALRFERRVPECTILIFGATGDLSKRKLQPALKFSQTIAPPAMAIKARATKILAHHS